MNLLSHVPALLACGAILAVDVLLRVPAVTSRVTLLPAGEVTLPLSPQAARLLTRSREGAGTYRTPPAVEGVDLSALVSAEGLACEGAELRLSPGGDCLLVRPPLWGWSRVPFLRVDAIAGAGTLVLRARYLPKDTPFLVAILVVLAAWRPSPAFFVHSLYGLVIVAVAVGIVVQALRNPGAARAIRDAAAKELAKRSEALATPAAPP